LRIPFRIELHQVKLGGESVSSHRLDLGHNFMTFDSPLTPDEETELHRRLLDNDPAAPSDLAAAYLDALIDAVRRTNPKIDDASRVQASEDAILSLIKNPKSFRTSKSLWNYLRMSAKGDLINALAREANRRKRNISLDAVEQGERGGKYVRGREPASLAIAAEDLHDFETRVLPCVRRGLPEAECKALEMMMNGEYKTDAFAAALGVSSLPDDEREAFVKRVKDKLKVRLKRCQERK